MKLSDVVVFLQKSEFEFSVDCDRDFEIQAFSTPDNVRDNCILWIKKASNFESDLLQRCKDVVIVTEETLPNSDNYVVVKCSRSKAMFFSILDKFFSRKYPCVIADSATVLTKNIGRNVTIGANSFVGPDVIICDNVKIGNNVSIENNVYIGDRTVIHSGTVIGIDGFGMFKDADGNNQRVPHYGAVRIGHDVELGANCVVNRGTLGDTTIGDYTKIDSAIHIPHNVVIGKNCMITSGARMCGSVRIGNGCYLAPFSCIKNQVRIGNNCMVNMNTVVVEDLSDGLIAQGKRRINMDYKLILNV